MQSRAVPLIAALLLLPAAVRAECPESSIPGAITARLDRSAVGMMQTLLLTEMPDSIPVPHTSYTLMTCPSGFDDTVITPQSGDIHIKLNSLSVTLKAGAIEVDGDLDVNTTTMLEMQLCAMPDATCPATLEVQGVKLHARIEPTVDACQPKLPVTVASVSVDPYAALIRLDSCGLYDDVFTLVYDWFRDTILGMVVEGINGAIRDKLPALIEGMVTQLIADGVDVYGLHFDAAAEDVVVGEQGIVVRFAANAAPAAGIAACLPPWASLPEEVTTEPAPVPQGNAPLAVTLSQPFLQRGVRAAWLSGWLCFDTRDYDLDLSEMLQPVAPGANLDATLVVSEPPMVDLTANANNRLQVSSAALNADIMIGVPGYPTANVLAQMSATLGGQMLLDEAKQALTAEVTDVGSSGLTMQAADDTQLIFSEATLEGVVQNFLLPAFANGVGPLALTSSLFTIAPVAARLDAVTVESTFAQANIDLWPIDKTDHTPPHTIVSNAPPSPSMADFELTMESLDDRTPPKFMRHLVYVDGVPQGDPHGGDTLAITGLQGGLRHVALMAVDLNDNVDPHPIELSIMVDDQEPVVTVVEAPKGVANEKNPVVDFVVVDDQTADTDVKARFEVSKIAPNGEKDELLTTGELGSERRIVLADLPEDSIVRITIFARDAAGNVGQSEVAFAIDQRSTFGCATSVPGAPAAWATLFLITGWRYRRLRRTRP